MRETEAKGIYADTIIEAAQVEAANELVKLIHSADPRVALEACREVLDRSGGWVSMPLNGVRKL